MESGGGEILPGPGLLVTSKPGGGRGGWRAALFILGNHADCKSSKMPSPTAGLHAYTVTLSLLLLLLPYLQRWDSLSVLGSSACRPT